MSSQRTKQRFSLLESWEGIDNPFDSSEFKRAISNSLLSISLDAEFRVSQDIEKISSKAQGLSRYIKFEICKRILVNLEQIEY